MIFKPFGANNLLSDLELIPMRHESGSAEKNTDLARHSFSDGGYKGAIP
jgi:hypothetical protein